MNVIVEKDNLLKTQEPYDYRKSTFLKNLKKKNKEIKDGRIILFMKHQYLKRIVNLFQISIIFCSTIITFFESLKRQILLSEDLTQIISICLSTYIAISTAIFKFIKIDDKKEEIYKLMQNFNDLENNIMNKIQKVKLLQDKFDDETKFNTKTPYILNALYNSIIQTNPNGSYLLKNSQNNEQDDNDQNGGIITDKDGNTVCKKQPSKKKKDKEKDKDNNKKKSNENNVDYESPCPNDLNLLFDRNKYLDSLFYNEEISKKDINKHAMDVRRNTIFKYNNDTQKLQKMGDLTNKVIHNKTKFPTKLKKMPSMSALFEDRENSDETSQDNISSTISDTHSSHGEDKHISTNILQQTMKHENFQIYLQILAKYEQEFQKIIQDYENEEIDNKILMAKTSFDALLSYNEIIYYNGKIVESMMLENVHKNNRNLLENDPIEELEYCKKRISDCRDTLIKNERNEHKVKNIQKTIDLMSETEKLSDKYENKIKIKEKQKNQIKLLDEEQKDELKNKIKHYAIKASKIYMEYEELQTDEYCINNFFNNFCLFFSNFCRFCLIMKLYLSLTLKSNKVRNLVYEIKQMANIREDDIDFFYFYDQKNDLESGFNIFPEMDNSMNGSFTTKTVGCIG